MAARDDVPDRYWADPLGTPIAYPLREHIADMYHGRRDGRRRIPLVTPSPDRAAESPDTAETSRPGPAPSSGKEAESTATAAAGEDGQTTAAVPGTAPLPVGTPHLMRLRALARDLIGQERLAMLAEMAALQEELAQLRARAEVLDGRVAAATRDLEAVLKNPPSDEDLKERRSAEADVTRRSDRLVRERRLTEYQRRCDDATRAHLAVTAELAQTTQALRACQSALERRAAIGRTRAHRIYEHAWRRVATYWQQLVRVHRHGPELNAKLRPAGPELPRWAVDGQSD